jgi:secretion/DNA translocation related TadE-like protein
MRSDEGSASVVVVGLCAVLLSAVLGALALGSAVVARHRAESAADLAALAAADVVLGRAGGTPCGRAESVLAAHGARSAGCAVAGDGSVTVTAVVRPGGVVGALGEARASARAGAAQGQRQAQGQGQATDSWEEERG